MGDGREDFAEDFEGDFCGEEREDDDLFSLVSGSDFLGDDLLKRPIGKCYWRRVGANVVLKVFAFCFSCPGDPCGVSSNYNFSFSRGQSTDTKDHGEHGPK